MARAQGARARMALAFETTYGTPPVSGFTRMPFASTSLGTEQPLLNSELLGYGRDPLAPIKDAVTADGDVVVPLDAEAFGFWLKAAFGDPATTGVEAPYTHEFQSGFWTLPSMSIETGMPEVPRYAMYSGCVLDQLSWQMQRSGLLTATARLVAQGETVSMSTSAGTPDTVSLKRFGHFNGAITRNGAALGNVVSAEITYANTLDRVETIRADGRIDGADPSIAALTGRIEVRFADQTLVDQALAGDPCEMEFAYGTLRMGGNMIWSSGLIERVSTREVATGGGGGKGGGRRGGGSTTVTEYSYAASFALAFGEGPAEAVLRIWADGKLIYDRTGLAGAGTQVARPGYRLRFHAGREDQLPDPLIEAAQRAGNVPAHRGLVLLVFEEFELADYGNRIPNITAEISWRATAHYPVRPLQFIAGPLNSFSRTELAVDWRRGHGFLAASSPAGLRRFNLHSMVEDRQVTQGDLVAGTSGINRSGFACLFCGTDGAIYCTAGSGNARPILRIDPDALREVARFGSYGIALSNGTSRFTLAKRMAMGNYVSFILDGTDQRAFVYTPMGRMADCDLICGIWLSATAGTQFRLVARVQDYDLTAPDQGYFLDFVSGAVELRKYGPTGGIATLDAPGVTVGASTWTMARLRLEGDLIRAKVWTGLLGDEPADWMLSAQDTDFAEGYAGIGLRTASDARFMDYFRVESLD